MEELLLGDFLGLGVMGDEDDLDVAVLGADELVEQEEEAARQVLLHRVHRARRVHDAERRRRWTPCARRSIDVPVGEVVVVEREAPRPAALGAAGRVAASRVAAPRGHACACARSRDRAALVEADADADLAVALALGDADRLDLAQRLALEVGQLEVLEHDVDQLLERDVGLVVVDAGLVAGLVRRPAPSLLAPCRRPGRAASRRCPGRRPARCRRRRSGTP